VQSPIRIRVPQANGSVSSPLHVTRLYVVVLVDVDVVVLVLVLVELDVVVVDEHIPHMMGHSVCVYSRVWSFLDVQSVYTSLVPHRCDSFFPKHLATSYTVVVVVVVLEMEVVVLLTDVVVVLMVLVVVVLEMLVVVVVDAVVVQSQVSQRTGQSFFTACPRRVLLHLSAFSPQAMGSPTPLQTCVVVVVLDTVVVVVVAVIVVDVEVHLAPHMYRQCVIAKSLAALSLLLHADTLMTDPHTSLSACPS